MEIDSNLEDSLQAYALLFNKCRFGFTSKINMDNLKFFSIPNQQRLGKIDVHFNINAIKHLPHNTTFNYLVMTEYQQIIPLIYLLRSQSHSCKILTTKSMIQSAKIYAQDFYHVSKKMNQVVSSPSYEQESETYDNYEIDFQIDFSSWVTIFSKQEIQNFAKRCITLNYGQIYDTLQGIFITPYPSGLSIGSAVWIFQNSLTKNKCLWVQGISHHSWRACSEFNINCTHQHINNIIFTAKTLANPPTTISAEHQCLQFLRAIGNRLNKGHNTRVVIHDFLVIADIVNFMVYELRDKFKKLFFTGCSVNHLMSYVNSFVEFLTFNHQKRIYEQPPMHPFQTYEQLRDKIISEGTLEELSAQMRVPTKQLILRSTPYIHFQSDFYAYLVEGDNQVVQTMFQNTYDSNKLRNWLSGVQVNNIIYICKVEEEIKNIPDLGHPFRLNLIGQNIYLPDQNIMKYYITEGPLPGLISHYKKKNGWLKLSSVQKKFRELKKDWYITMGKQLSAIGIQILHTSDNLLQTKCSQIIIVDYKISIQSSNESQLHKIEELLNQNSRIFKLG